VRCGKITEQEIPADAESGGAPPILAPPLIVSFLCKNVIIIVKCIKE
jgi:hypothetical protein